MKIPFQKKSYRILLTAALYAGFFCFSFFAHPQVLLDYDDWSYAAYFRLPVPWPTFWNPSRVLPECLMPLCGYFGALLYRLIPALGYIRAESLGVALVLSAFETVYVRMLIRLLRNRCGAGVPASLLAAAFFLLSHFLIFRTAKTNNLYLLRTANLTCVFFYLIPALSSASLVMFFLSDPASFEFFFSGKTRFLKKLLLLAAVYFCIFSNLFGNVILAVWAATELMKGLLARRKLGELLRRGDLCLAVLLLFLISAAMEVFGGRAAVSYGDEIPFLTGLKDAVSCLPRLARTVSSASVSSAVCVIAFFAVSCSRVNAGASENQTVRELLLQGFTSALLIGIYTVLLSAKVWAEYVLRPDILISFFFEIFLVLAVMLAAVLARLPRASLAAGVLCLLMAALVNPPGRTFAESYSLDCEVTPETCIRLSQDPVDQVIAADRSGEDHVTVEVMFTGNYGSDNWPQVTYLGDTLVRTLRKHGVIGGNLTAEIFPSDSFNEKYGLNFSGSES